MKILLIFIIKLFVWFSNDVLLFWSIVDDEVVFGGLNRLKVVGIVYER